MSRQQYANGPTSTLAAAITSTSATTLTIASTVGFPTTGPFDVVIDSEYLRVSAVSGTTWTITRGSEGTTATTHASGSVVTHVLTAAGLQNLVQVSLGGIEVSRRPNLNLIGNATATDNSSSNQVDITILSGGDTAYTQTFTVADSGSLASGKFTKVEGGTGSSSGGNGAAITLTATSSSGFSNNSYVLTNPATPYTLTVQCSLMTIGGSLGCAGIMVRNGSGVIQRFVLRNGSLVEEYMATYTSTPTVIKTITVPATSEYRWLRLHDDGTLFQFWVSSDGVNWIKVDELSRTTYVGSPSQCGICIESNSGTYPSYAVFNSAQLS